MAKIHLDHIIYAYIYIYIYISFYAVQNQLSEHQLNITYFSDDSLGDNKQTCKTCGMFLRWCLHYRPWIGFSDFHDTALISSPTAVPSMQDAASYSKLPPPQMATMPKFHLMMAWHARKTILAKKFEYIMQIRHFEINKVGIHGPQGWKGLGFQGNEWTTPQLCMGSTQGLAVVQRSKKVGDAGILFWAINHETLPMMHMDGLGQVSHGLAWQESTGNAPRAVFAKKWLQVREDKFVTIIAVRLQFCVDDARIFSGSLGAALLSRTSLLVFREKDEEHKIACEFSTPSFGMCLNNRLWTHTCHIVCSRASGTWGMHLHVLEQGC